MSSLEIKVINVTKFTFGYSFQLTFENGQTEVVIEPCFEAMVNRLVDFVITIDCTVLLDTQLDCEEIANLKVITDQMKKPIEDAKDFHNSIKNKANAKTLDAFNRDFGDRM